MNNEPVAWMVDGVLFTSLGAALNISFDIEQPCIPLYTHPVKDKPHPKCDEACMYLCQMRELTDEEIEQIADDHIDWVYETGFIEFARAILRKAQEK